MSRRVNGGWQKGFLGRKVPQNILKRTNCYKVSVGEKYSQENIAIKSLWVKTFPREHIAKVSVGFGDVDGGL